MALRRRVKRLEQSVHPDKLFVWCYWGEDEPIKCRHGRPYTEIPSNFTGKIIRVILPPYWKTLGDTLDCRNPRLCSCEVNDSGQAGGL